MAWNARILSHCIGAWTLLLGHLSAQPPSWINFLQAPPFLTSWVSITPLETSGENCPGWLKSIIQSATKGGTRKPVSSPISDRPPLLSKCHLLHHHQALATILTQLKQPIYEQDFSLTPKLLRQNEVLHRRRHRLLPGRECPCCSGQGRSRRRTPRGIARQCEPESCWPYAKSAIQESPDGL